MEPGPVFGVETSNYPTFVLPGKTTNDDQRASVAWFCYKGLCTFPVSTDEIHETFCIVCPRRLLVRAGEPLLMNDKTHFIVHVLSEST